MNTNHMTIQEQSNKANHAAYAAWIDWQAAIRDGNNAMSIALLKAVAVLLGKEAQRLQRCLPSSK